MVKTITNFDNLSEYIGAEGGSGENMSFLRFQVIDFASNGA